MLAHRLRHWPTIKSSQRLMFGCDSVFFIDSAVGILGAFPTSGRMKKQELYNIMLKGLKNTLLNHQ